MKIKWKYICVMDVSTNALWKSKQKLQILINKWLIKIITSKEFIELLVTQTKSLRSINIISD